MSLPDVRPARALQPDRASASRGQVRLGAAAVLVLGLSLAGWAVLIAWNASPHARYLEHDGLAHAGLGPVPTVAVFVAGWVLMLTAMMLPSTYSVVAVFDRVVARRPDRTRLLAASLAGYLLVWVAVGYLAHAGDLVLHAIERQIPAVAANGGLVTAAALALAGAYQLSPWKYRCLDLCRSPRAVVMTHWHGRQPVQESLRLGWSHGRWCVGCCWALMLVMFAVGHGNLGWMLLLGAVMTVEKVHRAGRRLTAPLGYALLAAGAMSVLVQVW